MASTRLQINTVFVILLYSITTIYSFSLKSKINKYNIDGFNKDSVLLQISADPRSEAIFASIAITLSDPNGGFDKVVAILTELITELQIEDRMVQKSWGTMQQSCQLGNYKLHERQEFFDGNIISLKGNLAENESFLRESKDLLVSRKHIASVYNSFLIKEKLFHQTRLVYLVNKINKYDEALFKTDMAIAAVQNWKTGQDNKDVIEKMKSVTYTYSEITEFKVEFDIKVFSDNKLHRMIKSRLLIWLGTLKLNFQDGKNQYKMLHEKTVIKNDEIEQEIDSIIINLITDSEKLTLAVGDYEDTITNLSNSISIYSNLSSKNHELIDINKEYCGIERISYEKSKANITDSIKLYRDMRLYFKDNYSVIKQFLKNKYRRIE